MCTGRYDAYLARVLADMMLLREVLGHNLKAGTCSNMTPCACVSVLTLLQDLPLSYRFEYMLVSPTPIRTQPAVALGTLRFTPRLQDIRLPVLPPLTAGVVFVARARDMLGAVGVSDAADMGARVLVDPHHVNVSTLAATINSTLLSGQLLWSPGIVARDADASFRSLAVRHDICHFGGRIAGAFVFPGGLSTCLVCPMCAGDGCIH